MSAVNIHRNLGFENVLQCFTKYIHDNTLWACTHVGRYGTAHVLTELITFFRLANIVTFFGLLNMLDATELLTFSLLARMLDAMELWGGVLWACTHVPRARRYSSSFCVCRPNMVAVLKVHVRNVENARGWSFVFKKYVFLKLDFVASYYYWTKVI